MIKQTSVIRNGFMYSVCVLALATISGTANAYSCVKKSHGHGHPVLMYPHPVHGYHSHMKPHGYHARGHRTLGQDTMSAPGEAQYHGSEADIIETATAAGNFNTLIKAAVAAGLYDTLRGEGPFTLFAPTDDAFAGLPDGMLEELLADKDMLAAVLSYHVVPGRLTAAELLEQREFETVQGQTLSIGALTVVDADIETGNGIVHVIDNVVVPSL